jgi:phage shock protein C
MTIWGLNSDADGYVPLIELMYCTDCGQQLRDGGNFCHCCGKPTGTEARPAIRRPRLVRVMEGKKIAGVCTGFARYLDVDVVLVRIVWLVIALTAGVGFIGYIVAWIAMPREERAVVYPHPATSNQGNTLANI